MFTNVYLAPKALYYWVSRSKRGSWHRAASARVPQRGQPGSEGDLDDKKVPIRGLFGEFSSEICRLSRYAAVPWEPPRRATLSAADFWDPP